jgi:hypothetical protein
MPMTLLAEEATPPQPVNPVLFELGQTIFAKLLTADPEVIELIYWDDFCLGEDYIGTQILECNEEDEAEQIMDNVINQISKELHYPGDKNDVYTEWFDEYISEDYYLKCSNNKISVEMLFFQDDVDSMLLKELYIFGPD